MPIDTFLPFEMVPYCDTALRSEVVAMVEEYYTEGDCLLCDRGDEKRVVHVILSLSIS